MWRAPGAAARRGSAGAAVLSWIVHCSPPRTHTCAEPPTPHAALRRPRTPRAACGVPTRRVDHHAPASITMRPHWSPCARVVRSGRRPRQALRAHEAAAAYMCACAYLPFLALPSPPSPPCLSAAFQTSPPPFRPHTRSRHNWRRVWAPWRRGGRRRGRRCPR